MQLRSNPLLKYALLGVLILVVYVGVTLLGKGKPQTPEQPQSAQLTPEQAKTLGIEGDTANDTLRTIVVESRQLKEQLNKVLRDNEEAKRENDGLRAQLSNINTTVDSRVQAGINQGLESQQKQTQGLFDGLQKQLNTLSQMGNQVGGNGGSGTDMPIGLGIAPGEGNQFKKGSGSSDLVWIEPQDGTAVDAAGKPIAAGSSQAVSGFAFPTAFGAAGQKTLDAASSGAQRAADGMGGDEQSRKKVRKVYTLPQNSTLMGSVSMTALVGRVPVDGTVNDPYPFKVLIGPDNLTANGIDLPDVAGAVVSGTASGDWTLSCVRGQIRSMTFVFTDGTVRTLPAPQENAGQQNNGQNNQNASTNGQPAAVQGGMGWISDPYGIPCIAGERRSNASQYIGSQALITAAGAGAASLIKNDGTSSSYVQTPNGTIGTTGMSGNEAMGKILNQGVSDISTWVNKLYGQAFAAVYVQPGAKVAIHLDQELAIDYELKGRKVDYRTGARHASAALD
ncbi:MAG: TIGR03752 family integrating conjugative element protein [Pseudomonas oryzihabitans]|jgi:integrating conjugative element protein (TIGR03752 family)|uniref:TIGR03752 family integrating conjugative element protein n=1 Tax=Pseudomonas oryzihabitans TaxID=47885 RepID=UPI0005C9973B|nr:MULTISPECIES: TIGR03752 family integrating conjugative element protein [Pseudomonas]KIZ52791.1 conjugal transfer protein [Pseudomonas oryzihabitans]MBA1256864.1 TIGR03752 family integrating conjugative element protein [Pseudomonas psychrotolerans]MDU4057887.1 TIGR03752 family integrating conjugative element protein [Pseudomonas oryzihabitans]